MNSQSTLARIPDSVDPRRRQHMEQMLTQVLMRESACDALRAALQALRAFRAGDLTQGELNALHGRANATTARDGAPLHAAMQELLLQDLFRAADTWEDAA